MTPVPFWAVSVLFLSSWLLYPLLLALLRPFFGKYSSFRDGPEEWPAVSVLIAARNEEAVIARRLENILAQDYSGRLEVLVGSDCSVDRTDEITASFADRGVILHRSDSRRGKPLMIQELLPLASGEVLVLTDADTVFANDTVRQLLLPFRASKVGCVDGSRRNSLDDETCESTYWKYERTVKKLCSALGAVLGATGAVFALRKDLFMPLSPRRADDLELAVMTRLQGFHCVFNADAVAMEPSPDDSRQYRRMVRIASWMFVSALLLMGRALGRGRFLLFLQLLVHKVLRWFSGLFLAAATVLAALLSGSSLYMTLFVLLLLFHLAAAAGRLLGNRLPSKLLFPYYFWLMNLAALDGILRTLSGRPVETWDKAKGGGG